MTRVTKIAEMKAAVRALKARRKTIGFVPTMGYLHEGHLSLVRESRRRSKATVVSIFVNPLQFGPLEDFREYPRDLARDARILENEGVDYLFCPRDSEMYPRGYKATVEVAGLQDTLCGRSRPGHFRGVATVVLKLFHIVAPDEAFFGQKDAQQAVILKRMVEDLNLDVRIRVLPTVRDRDGLALSSRNTYLSAEERRAALVLFRSLEEAKRMFAAGERRTAPIIKRMRALVAAEPLARVDYIEAVHLEDLSQAAVIKREVLIALAVFIGSTRLIDNVILRMGGRRQ
ncbi:MAG: pantoate--beta-alanine ligase [Acidobacteriota bacterium]